MTWEIRSKYDEGLKQESRIQGHMEYLFGESDGTVLQCGVRDGLATAALLYGVQRGDGHLFSVDMHPGYAGYFESDKWTFVNAYSDDTQKIETKIIEKGYEPKLDLVYLDTVHSYEQVFRELITWAPYVKADGKILVQSVTTYWRGAGEAARYFAHREKWDYQMREGWHGLGILRRQQK